MSSDLTHELIDLGNAVDRREFLRNAGKSSLAAGLLAAGLGGLLSPHGAAAAPQGDAAAAPAKCRDLTILSKIAAHTRAEVQCTVCECHDHRVYTLRQSLSAELTRADCDESSPSPIPDRSLFVAKLTRVLRVPGGGVPGACTGPWAGYHTGTFQIMAPAAAGGSGPVLFRGTMNGTDGLDSTTLEARCCAPLRDEGSLTGQGVSRATAGCKLIASYTSRLNLTLPDLPPDVLCDPHFWNAWQLSLVGIIDCPCPATPTPHDPTGH